MSIQTDYVASVLQNLAGAGVELNPSLVAVFTRVLSRQVEVDAEGNITTSGAFNQLAKVFTFVATPAAARGDVTTPNDYSDEALEAAKEQAKADVTEDEEPVAPTFSLTEALDAEELPAEYNIEDSAENILADLENALLLGAVSVTLTDAEITQAQADALAVLENFELGEVAVVEGEEPAAPENLTEALGELQDANAAVATAAETMNAGLGEEDTPAEYTADADGVETAREDVQATFDDVVEERDDLVEETAGTNTLSTAGTAGVQKYLGTAQELTEDNLTAAKDGVQADINADETVLFLDGNGDLATVTEFDLNNATEGKDDTSVDQLLDLTNAATSGDIVVDLATLSEGNKDSNGGGGSDTIILPKFADITGSVTINNMNLGSSEGADSLVAEGLETATVEATSGTSDEQGLYSYLNFTASNGTGGSVVFNNLINANTLFLSLVEEGAIVVQTSSTDTTPVSIDDLKAALSAPARFANADNEDPASGYQLAGDPAVSLFGAADALFNVSAGPEVDTTVDASGFAALLTTELDGAAFVELLEGYGNLIAEEDVAGNLESVGVTLADLQQQMRDAADALSSARDAKSDAALLDTVRAEISDYIGAGGNDVNGILNQRNTIRDLLNGDDFDAAQFELDSDSADEFDESVLISSDNFLAGLVVSDTIIEDGKAVFEGGAEAPTGAAGQGTWVQGDAVDPDAATVEYEWTYEPSTEEQALLDALTAVEDREALIAKEELTETNFESAVNADGEALGAQLLAIEGRLKDLADAEQAVVDAQTELDAANDLIDGLETALGELDTAEQWFADNDYALPVTLDGAESATAEGDIFIFAEDEGSAVSITGFGAEGQDTLFFGGDYTVTPLGEDESIEGRVGDVETLEIFWQQDGDDLQLFVESDAAAGFDRDGAALDQMTQVTLEGFNAEDITSFDGQSLIAGVAPTTEETIA